MLFLKIALPNHATEVLYLDEDTCSDLVNRFGRKLRKLLSLPFEQILEVLEGLKKGGHIRWHILTTEQTVVSSNFRDGCWNTYGVSVGVEVSFSTLGLVQTFIVAGNWFRSRSQCPR